MEYCRVYYTIHTKIFRICLLLFVPRFLPLNAEQQSNCKTIQAAFSHVSKGTYFFSGDEFIEYNHQRESEARYGKITELGLDSRIENPSAAFILPDDRLVFIKDCQYFTYQVNETGRFRLLEEGSNFGGLPCSPDAAVHHTYDTVYVYKGCTKWVYNNSTGTFRQIHSNISDEGVPCDLDAAINWWDNIIVFKGFQYWELNDQVQGPKHIDDFNICSWYICGEAGWMSERNRGRLSCNGDQRLCSLRLDQVTLPGLHNAGSGFDGGFSFLDCFVRNHAQSILEQLRLGIRHLDIDTNWESCGVLGSNHDILCGGAVCRMIKQIRAFLRESQHDVITLNFNHEMADMEKVLPALTRQLKAQLGPMLNKQFRKSRFSMWPTLQRSIRSNRLVFVFYTWDLHNTQLGERMYNQNKWIHKETWLASTWQEFFVNDDCSEIIDRTRDVCSWKSNRQLIEISVVPAPGGWSCIDTIAGYCRRHLHSLLRACEDFRFQRGKSPNVLLVDYPEDEADAANSVFNAVYHQNIRNIHFHKYPTCHVKIDAAVARPGSQDEVIFFVGSKLIVYNDQEQGQTHLRTLLNISDIENAYVENGTDIVLVKDCHSMRIDSATLEPITEYWSEPHPCYEPSTTPNCPHLESGGPCDIDATITFKGATYVFTGKTYLKFEPNLDSNVERGEILDWRIDVVKCS